MTKRFFLLSVLLLVPALLLSACSVPGASAIQRLVGQSPAQSTAAPSLQAPPSASSAAEVQTAAAITQTQSTTSEPAVLTASTVLEALQNDLSQVYALVNPSVVSLTVVQTASGGSSDFPNFPGMPNVPNNPNGMQQTASGSGFVWDTQGHIVTNNHVVEGASDIRVTFSDNTIVPATVVGTDPNSDLAVIKVDLPADQLHPVTVGDSTQLKVGDVVVAIGDPFGDNSGTMTVGFVSALGRSLAVDLSGSSTGGSYTIPDMIQTDAAINPGNSGGVLLNALGYLVGVPRAIESGSGSNAGIGYAIPSSIVQKVVPQLISKGSVEHPWIGISGTSLTSELAKAMNLADTQRGALVITVTSGSPADKAGLKASTQQTQINGASYDIGGDVIVAINGQQVQTFDDVVAYLFRSTNVGDTITLTILRDGMEQKVDLTLGSRPSGQTAQGQSQGQSGSGTTAGAWLGIQGRTLSSAIAQEMNLAQDQTGVLVEQVVNGSPADDAGLRGGSQSATIGGETIQVGGDVIIRIDGQAITSLEDLQSYLLQAEPGQTVSLTVLRNGERTTLDVTLGTRASPNQ